MHWILQEDFLSEPAWQSLLATLQRFDLDYSIHRVQPKIGELLPAPALSHQNVICIGSYSMRHVAARCAWQPGVFDLFAQDFVQQRAHWGQHMLNFQSVMSSVRAAKMSAPRMFVRPITDSKYFSGRVFEAQEFADWQAAICAPDAKPIGSLSAETEIQVSPLVQIYAEYRFWVVQGEIVTQSLYKRGTQVIYSADVDERVSDFVRQRIQEWAPHQAFVIDACDCEHGLKIVEINTLNSSGFYAADVQRLVLALETAFSSQA